MGPGDYIDDYCSRCKRSTDHRIVAMVLEEVGKVRCRTCNNDHAYRKNEAPNKQLKKEAARSALAGGDTSSANRA
jgi:hypothetical protein